MCQVDHHGDLSIAMAGRPTEKRVMLSESRGYFAASSRLRLFPLPAHRNRTVNNNMFSGRPPHTGTDYA